MAAKYLAITTFLVITIGTDECVEGCLPLSKSRHPKDLKTIKFSEQIKLHSHLQSNSAEIIKDFKDRRPLVITQNGKAKMVVMPIDTYSNNLEVMALLKIIVMGNEEIKAGQFEDANEWLLTFNQV